MKLEYILIAFIILDIPIFLCVMNSMYKRHLKKIKIQEKAIELLKSEKEICLYTLKIKTIVGTLNLRLIEEKGFTDPFKLLEKAGRIEYREYENTFTNKKSLKKSIKFKKNRYVNCDRVESIEIISVEEPE